MNKIFPTELNEFLQCRHIITLKKEGIKGDDLVSEELALLQQKGHEHEKNFLEALEGVVVEVDSEAPAPEQKKMTIAAMQSGADYIYQGYFEEGGLAGYSDFLEKVSEPSGLGGYSYEVIDTKLARRASAGNAVQLIHYAELVSKVQKRNCQSFHLVHGDGRRNTLERSDYIDYYQELLRDFTNFQKNPGKTEAFPVKYCSFCSYKTHCQNTWEENDDLARISDLKQGSKNKLNECGITNNEDLINSSWDEKSTLSKTKFNDIKRQSQSLKLQKIYWRDKSSLEKLLSTTQFIGLTFFRHIQPVNGAFTFFIGLQTSQGRFESININNSEEEKAALQRVIHFLVRYLQQNPGTVIFAFSPMDLILLHDLSNRYNICHEDVDELIFKQKLLSLQALIKQSLVLPVSRYQLIDLLQIFVKDFNFEKSLEKSPQILYDLYESKGVTDGLEKISERGRLELKAMQLLLLNINELNKHEFPVSAADLRKNS